MPDDNSQPLMKHTLGGNPRESDVGLAEYRQLRDARSAARAEERRQEGAAPGERVLKVAPEWVEVRRIAVGILDSIGQDIEVMVWLIEAETRLEGFAGLGRALGRLADMVTTHGHDVHPQPEDDLDRPFDMIGSLNGVGRDGTLISPLRLVPLVPDGSYGVHGLWNVTDGGGGAAVSAALAEAGTVAIAAQIETIHHAEAELDRCDNILSSLLGPESPPFSKIGATLGDAARTIRNLAGDLLVDDATAPDVPGTASDAPTTDGDPPAAFGAITSREEAFGQMLRIAGYFRRAEPHSPIADALETLVRRGRMDFTALLAELIPDEHARTNVLTTAGIGRSNNPPDGQGD